jgi:hypothetical protein
MNRKPSTKKKRGASHEKDPFANLALGLRPFELLLGAVAIFALGVGVGGLIEQIVLHIVGR